MEVDIYLHHKKALENEPTDFCVKLEGGFVDLTGLRSEEALKSVSYLEEEEKWTWCSE